jgi:hypothetical protein
VTVCCVVVYVVEISFATMIEYYHQGDVHIHVWKRMYIPVHLQSSLFRFNWCTCLGNDELHRRASEVSYPSFERSFIFNSQLMDREIHAWLLQYYGRVYMREHISLARSITFTAMLN